MPSSDAAWGIEVGSYAIKAIRLERSGDQAVLSDFTVIPHKKVLSTPDIDQHELIRLGLGQLISQKPLEGETLVMSIPGHSAFARFAKLPPVEPKKVPDIVKFEAVQQIPFPIDEVEWDYEVFASDDSPEIEVGIFAMTRERVQQKLALYSELHITPEALNLSPVAVFNAMNYDHDLSKRDVAVIYLDIGTNSSDVVIARKGNCWIRTFPLGGTHFTEAIANAFKLSYSKAEKLKHEAATSKYAKQIMQAMRPVFTDLLQDIQRSISYYESVHRDVTLETMVGLGSTFKIPGLRKFLGQQLQVNVVRLDEYRKIRMEGREAASFNENAVNMATAYGLALQGLGLAKIDVNLVPVTVLRDQVWHSKIKWFAAAAAIAIAGGAITFWRPITDSSALQGDGPDIVRTTIAQGRGIASEFEDVIQQHNRVGYTAENMLRLLDYRTVWPYIVNDSAEALQAADPQAELLGDDLEAIQNFPAGERRLVELVKLDGAYVPPGDDGKRYVDVTMRVVFTNDDLGRFLNSTVEQWLRDHAEPTGARENVPYRIVSDSISSNLSNMTNAMAPGLDQEAQNYREDRGGERRDQGGGSTGGSRGPGGSGLGGGGKGMEIEDPGEQQREERREPPRNPVFPGGGGGGAPPFPGGGGGGGGGAPPFPGGGGGGGGGAPPFPGGGGGGGGDRGGGDTGTGGERGGTGQPIMPPPGGGGENTTDELSDIDLNELASLAPMPKRPRLLPPNATFYQTDITFTVELLDPDADNAAAQATNTNNDEVSP